MDLLQMFLLFPDGFLLCDHGSDFFRSAYVRIQIKKKTLAIFGVRNTLRKCFLTLCRLGQSTSYNFAHPACGHKRSTHLSPIHAYEFLSRCRFSTPTPRQPMVELFVLASSRFPYQKSEEKITPAESRTHKFRLSGRMLYPLDHRY